MVNVGLIGHGVVGQGVAEILLEERDLIRSQSGMDIRLTRICDVRDFSHVGYGDLFTRDADAFFADDGLNIVVECMGGADFSRVFVKRALSLGKHVVTSNKELVVKYGEELEELARDYRVGFYYEASTGGGIPLIATLRSRLPGDRVERINGILNGTTNFILTRMSDGDAGYDAALEEAQRLGYAESNPSADVLGWDTRRKLTILAHVCFGARLDDTGIPTTGITRITREAMAYARHMERSIKLVASGVRLDGGWTGGVAPVMLPGTHMLSSVSDVFNAVMVSGDRVGDTMMYGRGAGRYPTASAIVADVVEAARRMDCPDPLPDRPVLPFVTADLPARYFIRLHEKRDDILDCALNLFPDARVVGIDAAAYAGECAIVTGETPTSVLNKQLDALKGVVGIDDPILYGTV